MSRGPARAVAVTADTQVAATRTVYRGCTFRETAGSTASIRVYNNSAASGTLLCAISLAANASFTEHLEDGVEADLGIYVDVVTGTVEGSVRVG